MKLAQTASSKSNLILLAVIVAGLAVLPLVVSNFYVKHLVMVAMM